MHQPCQISPSVLCLESVDSTKPPFRCQIHLFQFLCWSQLPNRLHSSLLQLLLPVGQASKCTRKAHMFLEMKSFSLLHSPEEMAFKAVLELFPARFMLMCFCYYCGIAHNVAITADGVGSFNKKYYCQRARAIIMFPRQQETKVMHL